VTVKSWIQDPVTNKLVPKEEYYRRESRAHFVQGDIEAFVSPITQETITDRGQLRRHMAEHGVTDSRDYSPEFLHKRRIERENIMTGNTEAARQDRIRLITRELDKRG
jgi:hypothetical protein